MSVKPNVYDLSQHGRVLATRQVGRDVGRAVADSLTTSSSGLVLGFWGVEVASPPFLDELLRALHTELWGGTSNRLVVVSGYNEDVGESLEIVLERQGGTLATIKDGQLDLLGGAEHLRATLKEAQKLGHFTARQLADELAVKLPNLHARLKALTEAGALARDEDQADVAGTDEARPAGRTFRAPDVVQVLAATPSR